MGFFSEAMLLIKMNKFDAAAKLMESHLDDRDLKPSARVGIMSWISECYAKADDRQRAAEWSEKSGRAALSCKDMPEQEKLKKAREEFETALAHYESINDVSGMGRIASLKYELYSSNA
jgi:hypothetical protein